MYCLNWERAYGIPLSQACFKTIPEDFQVNEFFDEPFSREGEHILLKIEKKGLTTEELLKSLSKTLHLPLKCFGYAGLKDRQAVTTQWISIHVPGKEIPGVEALQGSGWRVLQTTRHHKKLRPGFLTGNQFLLCLREVTAVDDILARIEQVKAGGVPNYFGEQRFGREAGNLIKAEELLVQRRKIKDRFLKGMYCSAARSWIFNLILAERVKQHNWNKPLSGDVMQLQGSNSIFFTEETSAELERRIQERDLSPASPLAGKSKDKVQGEARSLIQRVYTQWMPWVDGLQELGLDESWRANMVHARDLTWEVQENIVYLSFILPAGAYATIVLRELIL